VAAACLLVVVHVSADGQAASEVAEVAAIGELFQSEAKQQYVPDSEAYRKYMQNVADMAEQREADMQDTGVSVGDKAKAPDQYPTAALYKAYMGKVLKAAPPAESEVEPHAEDQSLVAPEGLGEEEGAPGAGVREVAKGKKTAQSSIMFSAVSSRAVDGRTDNNFNLGSCTHTGLNKNPWWRVDLGKTMNVQDVQVWNRGDCCGSRLSNFEVRVGDANSWTKNFKCGNRWTVPQGQSMKIACTNMQGRFVYVVVRASQYLTLCEVKVFASDNAGANAARGMPAAQSSTSNGGSANRAVDGKSSTKFSDNSCTHTKYQTNPWWRVDLAKPHTVKTVEIWNRGDCCGSRLSNFEVRVGNNKGQWSAGQKCGTKWSIKQGEKKPIPCNGLRGRYVWVVIRARQVLTLCEVRVLAEFSKKGQNLARNMPTSQSSTSNGGTSKRAVDGNVNTDYKGGSCTHTHLNNEPWWSVDLKKQQAIGAVQIWNRGDCCGARLSNFEVRVGNSAKWPGNNVCGAKKHAIPQGRRKTIMCSGMLGRHVFVVIRNRGYLSMCEVRVLPWKGKTKKGGCVSTPLGMETRAIKKVAVSSSSYFGDKEGHGPDNARLNYRGSAWQPKLSKKGEWLEVKLPKRTRLTAVATQGDFKDDQWVTNYQVRYLSKGGEWKKLGDFQGNVDRNTAQKNRFRPVKTDRVRFYPTKWKAKIAMRVELFGRDCKKKPNMSKAEAPNIKSGKKCASRRRSLKLKAAPGYGEGVARLWYAATKGSRRHGTYGKSVYVSPGVDFRTQRGSIYADKDLVASRYVKINAWPGFGSGSAKLWYVKRAAKTFNADTVYLHDGDFRTRKGSIYAAEDVKAGRFLGVAAYPGFGDGQAHFWYSAAGKTKADVKFESQTVYLQHGNLATQRGSIFSAKDVRASRYLTVAAFPKYGQGEARFWYVGAGKAPYKSNTVYLKDGNFATESGSISAKYDVHASQYLRLSSLEGYGNGETKLWFAKTEKNGYGPDTMYLKSGDFRVSAGSITAAKHLVAGRAVEIKAWPGFGSGSAHLWYSQAGKDDFKPDTMYLKNGDFRTQVGSIVASKDLVAGRSVKINSLPGHGTGQAELFYSHSAKGKVAAETLYLKSGDFRTQHGSIYAGKSLHAAKYLEVRAFPGYGSGSAKLWHCNEDKEGFFANSLYLKDGDFRTEAGSVYAAKDLVAARYLTVQAKKGFGSGHTKLWYSQTGKDDYRSNSLYLKSGDFRTEAGSIHAADSLHASKYLKIAAWPGHGQGTAKLWHSKTGHKGFGKNTLYLRSGHFHVQKGSLVASKDIRVGRYVKIGALNGFGSGHTQLWYSGTGKGSIAPQTLYLQSGDFHTQSGSIHSAKDVVAKGGLYGAKLEVKYASVPGQITAGHLYLGEAPKKSKPTAHKGTELEMDATTFLEESEEPQEVGKMIQDLSENNAKLVSRNAALHEQLSSVLSRLDMLEQTR
jgi:hypothetical protein